MTISYFTITLDPNTTTIEDANLPDGLQQTYIDVFAILTQDPTNIDDSIAQFETYYAPQQIQTTANAVSIGLTSKITAKNNVIQVNMDGDLVLSNSQPIFSSTKEESKNILGSVEKINNEIMIADAINKRAIIVDPLTQLIKWQYDSDRYVVDAHVVPKDNIVIEIRDDYVAQDVVVNRNQVVIFQNNLDASIIIYSGDISGANILNNFDESLYGNVFKSITLNKGDRWGYTCNSETVIPWFTYPNGAVGKIVVSDYKVSSANHYIITESDGLEGVFTSRVIKIDGFGNILWSFGEQGYLVKPRDARPLLGNKVVISL